MISLQKIRSPHEAQILFQETDFHQQTWLVSDLRSKLELQKNLLKSVGYFEDEMILRASEFWRLLLRRSFPEMQLASTHFLKALIRDRHQEPGADEILLPLLNQFSQVFSHPEGWELLQEWFSTSQGAKARSLEWILKARDLFEETIALKLISPKWVSPWLLHQDLDLKKLWSRDLIVDLGVELNGSESEFFNLLSENFEIKILEPVSLWDEKFFYLKKPFLKWEEPKAKKISSPIELSSSFQVFRYASPLAEAKHAVAWARKWLDEGTPADEILITAPSIENYWPFLEPLLSREGIDVSKDLVVSLESHLEFQKWFSKLKIAKKSFEYSDLENAVFMNSELPIKNFEKFARLFHQILEPSDLQRDQDIEEAFHGASLPEGPMSLKVFLGTALRYWPEDGQLRNLEAPLRKMLEQDANHLFLNFENWLFLLEQVTNTQEKLVRSGISNGIRLENLSSAQSSALTHRLFLGLTESQLRTHEFTFFNPQEVEKLDLDTGFQLHHPEQTASIYHLYWQRQSLKTTDHFIYAMSDFNGGADSPHPFCLELEESLGKNAGVSLPPQNVADVEMGHAFLQWQKELDQEDQSSIEKISIPQDLVLNVSMLENFRMCPFRFLASSYFSLQDLSDLDLDPDPRSLGQIAHRLFQSLTQEPRRFDFSDLELRKKVDEVLLEKFASEEKVWHPFRERWVQLARRFLEFEKNEISKSLQKTLGSEIRFQTSLHGFSWKGSIDRVDRLKSGKLRVFDYKSSESKFSFKNWQKNEHVQLPFYSWLIEQGHISSLKNEEVESASYYVFKDFSLHPDSIGPEIREMLQSHMQWAREESEKFVESLKKGEFPAKPKDEKTCESCQWRTLCRAPHLNH